MREYFHRYPAFGVLLLSFAMIPVGWVTIDWMMYASSHKQWPFYNDFNYIPNYPGAQHTHVQLASLVKTSYGREYRHDAPLRTTTFLTPDPSPAVYDYYKREFFAKFPALQTTRSEGPGHVLILKGSPAGTVANFQELPPNASEHPTAPYYELKISVYHHNEMSYVKTELSKSNYCALCP